MARTKSILTEARQIERAVTLIHLGARLQVLESETDLSYERLLRLYKEVAEVGFTFQHLQPGAEVDQGYGALDLAGFSEDALRAGHVFVRPVSIGWC